MNTDFSRLAPVYDLLGSVVFFGALRRSQNYFLEEMNSPEKVLILGGGTGTFLIDLLKNSGIKSVDYVDISPGMIKKAKKKFVNSEIQCEVNFICGGINEIPKNNYDLICTNYFLDCFSDEALEGLIPQLEKSLAGKGHWLFTDFCQDESSGLNRRWLIRFLYGFFSVTCNLKIKQLPNFSTHFKSADLEKINEKFFLRGLLKSVLFRKN